VHWTEHFTRSLAKPHLNDESGMIIAFPDEMFGLERPVIGSVQYGGAPVYQRQLAVRKVCDP
jgi:hypothetical protein